MKHDWYEEKQQSRKEKWPNIWEATVRSRKVLKHLSNTDSCKNKRGLGSRSYQRRRQDKRWKVDAHIYESVDCTCIWIRRARNKRCVTFNKGGTIFLRPNLSWGNCSILLNVECNWNTSFGVAIANVCIVIVMFHRTYNVFLTRQTFPGGILHWWRMWLQISGEILTSELSMVKCSPSWAQSGLYYHF